MLRPKILSAIFLITPGVVLLMAQAGFGEPAAEECKTKPGPNTPHGGHWFYRINRANQHCWYLGSSDAHARSSTVATTAVPAAQIKQDGQVADAAPASTPQTTLASLPSPVTTTAAPVAATSTWPTVQPAEPVAFTTRWPDNLSRAKALEDAEPVAASNSYANDGTAADAAQMPAQWSALDADERVQQRTLAEAVLRYFSVVGGLAIPAVLLAGWAAKYARRRDEREDELAAGIMVAEDVPPNTRRSSPVVRRRTPTDPAQDLKTSLAELMRDLHRVDAVEEAQPLMRPAVRQRRVVQQSVLVAAE